LKFFAENLTVNENFALLRAEKEEVQQKFAQHCDDLENLQKNFQEIVEKRKFEEEEYATNKAVSRNL